MGAPPTRRRFLRTLGATATTGIAGCASGGDAAEGVTVTPAPVPSDRPTPTPDAPSVDLSSLRDALELEVRARSGYDEASPPELDISLRNASDTLLTVLDGPAYSVPFVDDDYVGTDWSGDPELLLLPDGAELILEPDGADPGPVQSFLPTSSGDGCWTVPFDWPAARVPSNPVLHAIPLRPGERRQHGYRLYPLDGCATGTFTFVNTFDVSVGDPPFGRDLVRARLGFDIAISEVIEPLVRVHDPVVGPAAADD